MWNKDLRNLILIGCVLIFSMGTFSYAQTSFGKLPEIYSEQIRLFMKEGKAESPELYLLNAENELGKLIYNFELWKRTSPFNYWMATGENPPEGNPPWPPQVKVLTQVQIETEEKAALEEDRLLRGNSRQQGKEILDHSIKSVRKDLCPMYAEDTKESGKDIDLLTFTDSVLVSVVGTLVQNRPRLDVWLLAPTIVIQIVPFVIESGIPNFCRGYQS